jgi:hypothetical protein
MTATGEQQAAGEINRLLVRLTRFLLRNSAEGAMLTVWHRDDSTYAETVQVTPDLARLDLVSEGKFLVRRIVDGELGRGRRTGR